MADQTFVIVDATGTEHEFPVSMDPKRAAAIVRGEPGASEPYKTARTEDFHKPNIFQQGLGTSIKEGALGAVRNLGSMIPAVIDMVTSPQAAIENATQARYDAWNKGNDTSKGLLERGAYKAAGLVPFVGPAIVSAAERLGSGDPEEMGAGASDVALMAAGSPTVRAGAKTATKAATKKVADASAARFPRATAAVRTAAENPMTAAVGAYEGYSQAGIPGAVAGAVGLPMGKVGLLKELAKVMRPEAAAAAPKAPKVPKEQQPRLTDPRITGELRQALESRLDEIPSRSQGPVDSTAIDAATMARIDDAMESPARNNATTDFTRRQAPQPVPGARVVPRQRQSGTDVAQDAVESLRNERAPNQLAGSHQPQGMDARTAPQMESLHDVLERQIVDKMKREQGIDLDNPVEGAYRDMPKPGDDAFASRLVQVEPEAPMTIAEEAAALQEPIVRKIMGGKGENAALNAERDALAAQAAAEAPPTPALAPTGSRSRAARGADNRMSPNDMKVYADNIRKGMSEEEAMADMLRQRAERASGNFARESAAAAKRREQNPILPEVREMLEASLKERSGR